MTVGKTATFNPIDSMSGTLGMNSGMVSGRDIATLDAASGSDAGKLLLIQMKTHQQGAITTAKTEISGRRNAHAIKLTNAIITSQSAEIAKMADLLNSLK